MHASSFAICGKRDTKKIIPSVKITIPMSFDHLLDLFGKFRKKRNRFTNLERKATDLMASFFNGSITSKEFAMAFEEVRKNYLELTNVNGQPTIDQDTPLWLNSLLGLHYVDWYRVQQMKWYYEEHPDELVG